MAEQINPAVKALTVLIPGFLLSFSFDVLTPLLFLLFLQVYVLFFSGIARKRWLLLFPPFLIAAAGFAWMAMLYTSSNFAGGDVLFSVFHLDVTSGSLVVGISLALRSLCFVSLSLLFVLTTDPTRLMLSLMQQAKLPPKITYGILAGYRFVPLFRHEFRILRQAQRVRGVTRVRGWKGRLLQVKRCAVPLLANAIRRAERTANAMESKGFTGSGERTHFHPMRVTGRDWRFFGLINGMLLVVFGLSYYFGYLRIFGIQVGG
ncbi:energy-coupling factor transporter transmembrane component T family protein [Alkalicoccus chagannorensis]|uniref:energy-coupling factor transporter transmembrane component T family protein n=1 Tax=Alkalicoccus chagannorensis TaxID=427072 RepID=UPI000404B755|nr:energy-coupling factor transporter transmembrane component T [Alkalicoccus chagannorensis]